MSSTARLCSALSMCSVYLYLLVALLGGRRQSGQTHGCFWTFCGACDAESDHL